MSVVHMQSSYERAQTDRANRPNVLYASNESAGVCLFQPICGLSSARTKHYHLRFPAVGGRSLMREKRQCDPLCSFIGFNFFIFSPMFNWSFRDFLDCFCQL